MGRRAGPPRARSPDLVALFCAAEHAEAAHDLAEALSDLAPDAAVIGACAADGVIGAGREQQGGAALALLAATLPARSPRHAVPRADRRGIRGARAVGPAGRTRPAHSRSRWPILTRRPSSSWSTGLGGRAGAGRLRRTRRPRRRAPVHERRLRRGGRRRHRARGPAGERDRLAGSPADRPGARGHSGRGQPRASSSRAVPALERVQQVVEELPLTERAAARERPADRPRDRREPPGARLGDFLVRGVLGADAETGALAIGDVPARRPDGAAARPRRRVGLARARRDAGASGARSRRPPRCCSRATAAAATCSRRPTTTPARSARAARERRGRGLLLPGRARAGRRTARSCTASPPASRCGERHRTVTRSSPPRHPRPSGFSDAGGMAP